MERSVPVAGGQQPSDAIRRPRHRRADEDEQVGMWGSSEVWDAESDAVAAKLREWRLENERRNATGDVMNPLTDAHDRVTHADSGGSAESGATESLRLSSTPGSGSVRPGSRPGRSETSLPDPGSVLPDGHLASVWSGDGDTPDSERADLSEPAVRAGHRRLTCDADSDDQHSSPYHVGGTSASLSDAERPSVPGNPMEALKRMDEDAGRSLQDAVAPTALPALDGAGTVTDRPAVKDEPTVKGEGAYAIQAVNLHKRFKDTVAVQDVSFSVPSGSIVAILGPNGAGKTTTVNMLSTLLRPDGGSATVNGHDVIREAAAVRRSIMLTGQFAALDESLTGRENLVLFGRLLGLSRAAAKTRADQLLEVFSLTDAANKLVRQYSGGMRRRIDIACGLVTSPKVVFLDEPTTGLDPRSRQEVWALVGRLRDEGVTILLTTQYLEEADVLSDNIVVIDKGRVIAQGTADELKEATGAAYCEVTPADAGDLDRLLDALSDLVAGGTAHTDDHTVSVPAPQGTQTLVEVIRRTSEAGIRLSDVAMRRPSLDEVFLALTDPDRNGR
ncbi:ATP-binding cassette domain-containing protein [Gordonia paraffinivorans]|uniref:ATP-binding cassette domain-containing protein n=1 Tax=Gordonia paraffinivorans TaxID=175628 RepID=UPI001FF7EE92|nr:ATP-binding cassette domain-containing protein [Gordonia paraffinivorans]